MCTVRYKRRHYWTDSASQVDFPIAFWMDQLVPLKMDTIDKRNCCTLSNNCDLGGLRGTVNEHTFFYGVWCLEMPVYARIPLARVIIVLKLCFNVRTIFFFCQT